MPRAVLLLHPLGSDRQFFESMNFPTDRQWLAVDLPGHGPDPMPVGRSIDTFAGQVLKLADEAGTDRFDVVGVSLGGLVAQYLAVYHPQRVGRVGLVDTVATYPVPMRAMWADRAQTARRDGMAELVEPTLDVWFTREFREARPEIVDRTIATLLRTDAEGYARTCEVLAEVDLTDGLSRLPAATLAICGQSEGEPFRNAAEAISDATGRPALWLPGKHAAALENPDDFVRHLVSFLDGDLGEQPPLRRISHE